MDESLSSDILAAETLKVIDKIEHRSDVTLASQESELTLAVRRPDENG